MMKRIFSLIIITLLVVPLTINLYHVNAFAHKADCTGTALCIVSKVKKIIDGDTLVIGKYKVRLSLVNTPEKKESGYKEAKMFTSTMCKVGSRVTVDQDDIQRVDKYKRILGKVICAGKVLNAQLLYNGHAKILTQYCSTSEFANEGWAQEYGCKKIQKEQEQFSPQQSQISDNNTAPVANAGPDQTVNERMVVMLDGRASFDPDGNTLSYSWSQIAGSPVTLLGADTASPSFYAPSVDTQTILTFQLVVSDGALSSKDMVNIIVNDVAAPTPAQEEKKCDPSYPDVCIPPPPPDLDCTDISYRNFKVLPPDPHRFDRDRDGIGCET